MPKNYHKNDQKNKDQIKQMVFNRLDHMVKEASKIAKMFGRTGINFNAWATIIESAKANPAKEGFPKSTRPFFDAYDATLDSIHASGRAFAENNSEVMVPVEFIEMVVEETKEAFGDGMKSAKK